MQELKSEVKHYKLKWENGYRKSRYSPWSVFDPSDFNDITLEFEECEPREDGKTCWETGVGTLQEHIGEINALIARAKIIYDFSVESLHRELEKLEVRK